MTILDPMRNHAAIPQRSQAVTVETYPYSEGKGANFPAWLNNFDQHAQDMNEEPHEETTDPTMTSEELALHTADAQERGFSTGLLQGREEGRLLERNRVIAELGDSIARLLQQFEDERSNHFQALEHEAVKLAIVLAARVLRRELQLDPLLLTGAVRAALGQVAAGTHVKLNVPAGQFSLWQEAISLLPNLPLKPELVAVETMSPGDCLLQTELGSLDLGLRAQLRELEHSLLPEDASSQSEVRP